MQDILVKRPIFFVRFLILEMDGLTVPFFSLACVLCLLPATGQKAGAQFSKNFPTCSIASLAFLMGIIWNTCHISFHSSI